MILKECYKIMILEIAKFIVDRRNDKPIETTLELVDIISITVKNIKIHNL